MENRLEISIYNSINNFNHLIALGSTEWFYRMVQIEKYSK